MAVLPTGTVTFLFTDVEGSTRLLHELGDQYADVLSEHRRVLRDAFARHGGVEVDTQGDAFFVAFPKASDALAAAASGRDALQTGPIRVRMGLHTGEPMVTDEGYIGLDVHRAARIAAAGHGGQILVSQSTRELIGGDGLRDLGEHRLKDLTAGERIYQLGAGDFPPLKSLNQTNLPTQPTPLVGREEELGEIQELLRTTKLLTLTGAGGSGKTRLALQAAAETVDRFADGVWFVSFAAVADPELVEQTISQTLALREPLGSYLSRKELLLVVDNLEQLLPEGASAFARLDCTILATSRERLNVAGEREYEVLPLPLADAVALFTQRAQNLRPAFEADENVREIARRVDCLPLALELAASRVKVLKPAQILERLEASFELLAAGPRDAPERQRTLSATIRWSYELLVPTERTLFMRLAVFAGGFDFGGAEAVADATVDTLGSLVDKSLLRQTAEGRFFMLETIRQFALERLDSSSEARRIRRRHAENVVAIVEAAAPHLSGVHQSGWLDRLQAEQANVRAALDWSLGAGESVLALRIAAALGRFWWVRAPGEGLTWLERALTANDAPMAVRAAALDAAGGCAWFVGDGDRASAYFEEGLTIYRALGDRAGIARMLNRLAPPRSLERRFADAERLLQEALAINRELEEAGECALSLNLLAGIAGERGDWSVAVRLSEESLALARDIGDLWLVVANSQVLADAAIRLADLGAANRHAAEALRAAHDIRDGIATLIGLVLCAITLARSGRSEDAGVVWGAMESLDGEVGENMWRDQRAEYSELLGERTADFEHAVARGQSLGVEAAVSYALAAIEG